MVILKNDMRGLKFLLEVGEHLSAQRFDPDEEVSGFYSFPDSEFRCAVELGRVELLKEIIKRTGAGLPLEHLIKDTGLELKEKPRYYQGLTVYGKKRYVSLRHTARVSFARRLTGHAEMIGQQPAATWSGNQAAALRPRPFSSLPCRAGSRVWSGSSAIPQRDIISPLPNPRPPARMRS